MNTLWTFGDSFTKGTGCEMSDEYHINYFKDGNKIWPSWLSELLNTDLENCGFGGYSNDMILDSIIDNWKDIKKGDIVLIGFTYPHRFDVPIDGKLQSIVHNFSDKPNNNLTNEEFETLVNFQYHFSDNILYKNRQVKRFEWIKSLLQKKECKLVVIWDVQYETKNLETITGATNGKIKDEHLSYSGHKMLAEIFYKKYIVKDFI
jgi:hypothetical protein